MHAAVTLTLLALVALLAAEYKGSRIGVWIAKPLASTGFITVAIAAGALDHGGFASRYSGWVLVALGFSWWGDVLLIESERPALFRAGLVAFLLGHVAFAVAFASRGLHGGTVALVALALVPPVTVTLRWLRPHVPPELRVAVFTYVTVISVMVVCAAGTVVLRGGGEILLGAGMFYLSDLSVARDRFVAPGFVNGLWGLPLYYGGQLVLASTAAG